jgi:outer membrane receptor protein involved in Fe transport
VKISRIAQFKVGAAPLVVGIALIATPAFAQDTTATNATSDNTGDIVVTGTLIRNPNLTSSSPVNVIGDAEISRRVPATTEELVRSIPGVSPGVGSQVNNGSNGTNSVDLRGLGVQRNLVLLDGNRIVPTLANGAVDLNVIPIALVQRVDVLTGGASTTYGADAVSGVVNFVTRKDFSGVDFRTSYRITEEGDGSAFRADLTLGGNFNEGRGNAVLSVGYSKVDPVYQIRDFSLFGIGSTNGRASGSSFTSVPVTISFPTADRQLNNTGTALVPQYQGFNFNPYNIFQTPMDRKSVYAAANYEVADGIEVYARGMFVNNTVSSIIAPSGIFGEDLTVPGNNPYLPAAVRDELCTRNGIALGAACTSAPALDMPAVYRRLVELGPRIGHYENNNYDIRAGVRGDVTSTINFDLNASYGRSEQTLTQSGYVLTSRVQQALNASNTTSCANTARGCVPLNLFGPAGSITPDMVKFLQGQSTTRINTELTQVRGVFSGDFGMTLPGAANPVSFAAGAEYRKYNYDRIPDAYAQDPSELGGAGGATLPMTGSYDVKEGFFELIAPIMTDRPFFDDLTVEAGARYSSYSVSGGSSFDTWTYKGGLTWQPVPSLRLRGNYQRAVRAPNISELFAPVTTGLTNLTSDPCAGSAPVGNANLTAVCIAQGSPAASIGSIQNPSAGQANVTGGGNLNIRPEKADTFTIGAVITPDFVPGLSLTIDYYNIRVNHAITAATPNDVIGACFNNITATSATSAACLAIHRNPTNGRLSGSASNTPGLDSPLTNNGRLTTDGIDLSVNYTRDLGPVGLTLNFVGNWTHKLVFQASPTSVARDCVGYYSANCGPSLGQIQPEFSWQQRTMLSFGGVDLSLLWRHISAVDYEGTASDYLARGFTAANHLLYSGVITNATGANSALAGKTLNFNHIKAYDYFDLTAQFHVSETFDLTVGVSNLFNRQPPVVGGQAGSTTANSGNIYPSTYDPLGRSFTASVRLKF